MNLKDTLKRETASYGELNAKRHADTKNYAASRKVLEFARERTAFLMGSQQKLTQSLPTLELEYATYRSEYRRQTWSRAVGQSLGTLIVREGQEYQHAVVTKVTVLGLEIRHDAGTARLHARDLSNELQERFQLKTE